MPSIITRKTKLEEIVCKVQLELRKTSNKRRVSNKNKN